MNHPLAIPGNKSGFTNAEGQRISEGDSVFCKSRSCRAVVDEVLPDGEVFVTFDDGTFGEVKWGDLMKDTKE